MIGNVPFLVWQTWNKHLGLISKHTYDIFSVTTTKRSHTHKPVSWKHLSLMLKNISLTKIRYIDSSF